MRLYLQLRPAGTSYILQLHFVLAELVVTSQAVVRLSLAPAPSTPSSLHLLQLFLYWRRPGRRRDLLLRHYRHSHHQQGCQEAGSCVGRKYQSGEEALAGRWESAHDLPPHLRRGVLHPRHGSQVRQSRLDAGERGWVTELRRCCLMVVFIIIHRAQAAASPRKLSISLGKYWSSIIIFAEFPRAWQTKSWAWT